jgi:hypothetical protein
MTAKTLIFRVVKAPKGMGTEVMVFTCRLKARLSIGSSAFFVK